MTNFSHQAGLFDPRQARKVIVIGVGSIGSYVTLGLAKMGVTDITVIDGDTVASHNVPMSLYRTSDCCRRKVDALAEIVGQLTGVTIRTNPNFYNGEALRRATVIACVDKMSVRKMIWEQVRGQFSVDLFIDTRTAGMYFEVHAVSPRRQEDISYYESVLYPDEETARQTCGHHGIVFTSLAVTASVLATVARSWNFDERKRCHAGKSEVPSEVQL